MPMILAAVDLMDDSGDRHEAVAFASGEDGRLLAPGLWRIVSLAGLGQGVMAIEDMPDRWRRQIEAGAEHQRQLEEMLGLKHGRRTT